VKSKNNQRQVPAMVDEGATKRLKKRGRDSGKKHGTIASQTKTTGRLDQTVKRDADARMAGTKKAVEQWEGEGGAVLPKKKGGKQ